MRLAAFLPGARGAVWLGAAVAAVACGAETETVEIEQRGDTVVMRSIEPKDVNPRNVQIDLKIGGIDGDPSITFGRLEELAVLPSGGFVVHDNHFMRVSMFDESGRFLRRLGSRGQGPGQFDAAMGLGVSGEGIVFVLDYDGGILLFNEDGSFQEEWRLAVRPAVRPFLPAADSLVRLKTVEQPGTLAIPTVYGFATVDPGGRILNQTGPISVPSEWEVTSGQPQLASRPFVEMSPLGFVVSGVTGQMAFQIHRSDGGVVRVEREVEPTPFLEAEWTDWEAQNEFLRVRAGDRGRYPPTPTHKPPIRGVFLPPTGEIWIQRSTEALGPDPGHVATVAGLRTTPEWLEPLRFDVYSNDGQFAYAIEGPPGVDVRAVTGDAIWGYVNGELGEHYVVRLAIDVPLLSSGGT